MKKIVIGMIGKAGSGKDTVADYLVKKYLYTKVALADPLKAGVKATFMLDDFTVYDRVEREKPLVDFPEWSVRKLLQFVGTELYRTHFDPDIWVKLLIKRVRESDKKLFTVSDVRFPNERDLLSDNPNICFFAVKVERDGCLGYNIGIQNHASEMFDLPAHFTIKNDGSIEDLYNKVDELMINIMER